MLPNMQNWKTSKGWHTISLGVPNYTKGKFLFFSKDKNKLIALAENEVVCYGFPFASIPKQSKADSYVLCIFDETPKRLKELKQRYDDEYEDGELSFRGWKDSKGVSWQGCTVCREDRKHALAWRKQLKSAGAIGRFSPDFKPTVDDTGPYGAPESLDFDLFGEFDFNHYLGTGRIF